MKLLSARSPRPRAVTILELLVAISLISFIILALYQMFNTVQLQMRKAVRDTDKFESGRAAADLLQRDLTQMIAANSDLSGSGVNFYTSTNWSSWAFGLTNASNVTVQLNTLQDLYFLTFDPTATPTNWTAVGYRVASRTNASVMSQTGVGTLYRWTTNANRFTTNFQRIFITGPPPASFMQRVVDNVVHFRVTALTNGVVVPMTNIFVPAATFGAILTNSALPSQVAVELGYLDSRTAGRAAGFEGNTNAMRAFLGTNVDNVHVFRLNLPVRTGLQ